MMLLTAIIMISILTMLVLLLMQTLYIYIKASNQVVSSHNEFYQLETAARFLSSEPFVADCILTNEDPNKVIELLRRHQGCLQEINHRQFYYLIDDLGRFPCLNIMENDELYASRHWLISVLSKRGQRTLLQLRIARLGEMMDCRGSFHRQIPSGIVSWRYLS
jgi:hypothetical protein